MACVILTKALLLRANSSKSQTQPLCIYTATNIFLHSQPNLQPKSGIWSFEPRNQLHLEQHPRGRKKEKNFLYLSCQGVKLVISEKSHNSTNIFEQTKGSQTVNKTIRAFFAICYGRLNLP